MNKNKDSQPGDIEAGIDQPMTSADVDPNQKQEQRAELDKEYLASNPGDRIDDSKSVEEKAKQVAVDTADITGPAFPGEPPSITAKPIPSAAFRGTARSFPAS